MHVFSCVQMRWKNVKDSSWTRHTFQHRKHKRGILGTRLSSEIGFIIHRVHKNADQLLIFQKGRFSVCLFKSSLCIFLKHLSQSCQCITKESYFKFFMLASRNQLNRFNHHCWDKQFCDWKMAKNRFVYLCACILEAFEVCQSKCLDCSGSIWPYHRLTE